MEGNELQQRREALGMSRDEFAKALHTTSVSVWRWENGERGIPAHLPLALETVERNHQGNGQRTARKATTQPAKANNGASAKKKGSKK
jgi:transcriptional regulator with XRE-family HTH domain